MKFPEGIQCCGKTCQYYVQAKNNHCQEHDLRLIKIIVCLTHWGKKKENVSYWFLKLV